MMSDSTSALLRSRGGSDAATERRRTRGGIVGGERSEPPVARAIAEIYRRRPADGPTMDYTVDAASGFQPLLPKALTQWNPRVISGDAE